VRVGQDHKSGDGVSEKALMDVGYQRGNRLVEQGWAKKKKKTLKVREKKKKNSQRTRKKQARIELVSLKRRRGEGRGGTDHSKGIVKSFQKLGEKNRWQGV